MLMSALVSCVCMHDASVNDFLVAAGFIAEFLTLVSGLPALQSLDVTNQWLIGTLPANLSFPRLTELRLTYNDLQVGIVPSDSISLLAFASSFHQCI